MVNFLNCDLIAMMLFTLTLGDSYLPFLAYSCFPITTVAFSGFFQKTPTPQISSPATK